MSDQIGRIEFGPQYAEVGPWTLPGALIPVDMDTTAKLAKALNTALNEKADAECRERGLQMEIERLTAYAGALEAAIRDEPEMPGPIPEAVYQALQGDRDACAEALRVVVRLTKKNILENAAKAKEAPGVGAETPLHQLEASASYAVHRKIDSFMVDGVTWVRKSRTKSGTQMCPSCGMRFRPHGDGMGADLYGREQDWDCARCGQRNDGWATKCGRCEEVRAKTPAERYQRENPLGGPAKMFYAIGDRITAGEDFHFVLRDMVAALIGERPQTGNESCDHIPGNPTDLRNCAICGNPLGPSSEDKS